MLSPVVSAGEQELPNPTLKLIAKSGILKFLEPSMHLT